MKKHYVRFLSPGTFVSELSDVEIESWNVEKACEMARDVKARYSATPYGFTFFTRERSESEFEPKITAKSEGTYFLGGVIRKAEEILAGDDPKEETLRWNVKYNDFAGVITNTNSWKITLPFEKNDVLLDWKPDVQA